jgi:opacity protein-like surface antigen
MNKWMVLFVIVMLCVSLAVAADNEENRIKTSQGDNALLFTIGGIGDFNLGGAMAGMVLYSDENYPTSEYMTGIGFKTFLSDNMALRIGFAFEKLSYTEEDDAGDYEQNYSTLAIMPAIEYHLYKSGPVSIYTGAGLFFASMASASKAGDADETTLSWSSFGVAGLLGAEFYPWKSVSFGAEYQLGFASGSSKHDNGTDSVDGPKLSMLGTNTFGVTLGFHF